jgi:hypothetical protein
MLPALHSWAARRQFGPPNQVPEEHNMTRDEGGAQGVPTNTEKDPDQWVTGDEAMTGAQRSYLKTLSDEAKVDFDETLTKAEASKRIDELQERTGRGRDH